MESAYEIDKLSMQPSLYSGLLCQFTGSNWREESAGDIQSLVLDKCGLGYLPKLSVSEE